MSEIKFPIYLDSHATTPVDPRVFDEMTPYFTEKFGNASSLDHSFGYDASVAVQKARERIANAIGASMDEIVFTSGATESDNLALVGVMEKNKSKGNHLITCVTEHKAILDTARHLESQGSKVTFLPVDEFGVISIDEFKKAITDDTVLVTIRLPGSIEKPGRKGGLVQTQEEITHNLAQWTANKQSNGTCDLGSFLSSQMTSSFSRY